MIAKANYYKNTSDKIVSLVNRYHSHEGIELIRLQYGMEMLVRQVFKILLVLCIGIPLGVFPEIIITLIAFNLLRNQTYGIHAKTSRACMITSILTFDLLVYCLKTITISGLQVFVIGSLVIGCVALYGPADTKKRPIRGQEVRKRLKRRGMMVAGLLTALALVLPSQNVKVYMMYGMCIQVISLLPITYKLLKEERRNDEKHESGY